MGCSYESTFAWKVCEWFCLTAKDDGRGQRDDISINTREIFAHQLGRYILHLISRQTRRQMEKLQNKVGLTANVIDIILLLSSGGKQRLMLSWKKKVFFFFFFLQEPSS